MCHFDSTAPTNNVIHILFIWNFENTPCVVYLDQQMGFVQPMSRSKYACFSSFYTKKRKRKKDPKTCNKEKNWYNNLLKDLFIVTSNGDGVAKKKLFVEKSIPTVCFAPIGINPLTWDALLIRRILYKIAMNKN